MGTRLAGDGDRSEAADAMNEAVDIYRRVADTNPDAVDRELGGVLRDLLDLPPGVARQRKALAYTSLMVKIVRPAALVNPSLDIRLAKMLNDLSNRLAEAGAGSRRCKRSPRRWSCSTGRPAGGPAVGPCAEVNRPRGSADHRVALAGSRSS